MSNIKDYVLHQAINEVDKNKLNCKVFLFGIVNRLEEKLTSGKKPYVEFILTDKTGEIVVKVWDTKLEQVNISNADLVKVGGNINVWEDRPQLITEKINDTLMLRKAVEKDCVLIEDYVRSAPVESELMFNEILAFVENFQNEELKAICLEVLNSNKEKLIYYPGAKTVHHAYRSGLLYHIYSMYLSARGMSHYPGINMELLVAGIIVHDIGKLVELNANSLGIADDYTKTGQLLGHIVDGIRIMERVFMKLNTSEEISTLIHHMIASHHYELQFGAYQMPKFLEAELLHHLDTMDSRINMIATATTNIEPGNFGVPSFFLNKRAMYVPNVNAIAEESTIENENSENVTKEEKSA